MVNSTQLDSVFGSLADPIRRDILVRLSRAELTVGEIARPYTISLPAISKHLRVLERANMIMKIRRGKQQVVRLSPATLIEADAYLRQYRQLWGARLDSLDAFLAERSQT